MLKGTAINAIKYVISTKEDFKLSFSFQSKAKVKCPIQNMKGKSQDHQCGFRTGNNAVASSLPMITKQD